MRRLSILILLVGCGPSWPLDDVLRLDHLQVVGTHNSYHVQTAELDAWSYTHESLDIQIREQGVRQFELDCYWDADGERWEVFHLPSLDEGTTCETLAECVQAQAEGLRQDDVPIVTLIELKTGPANPEVQLDAISGDLLAAFESDALVYPAELMGEAGSLAEAVALNGWPTLGELRGRAVYVLHSGDAWRGHLTADDTEVGGRPLFAEAGGNLDCRSCGFQVINTPTDDRIAAALGENQLVRTRADVDSEQAIDGDPSRRDAAFASGAFAVSTDWPAPHPDTGYVVDLAEGRSAVCNPVTAPPECTDDAVSRSTGSGR